MIDQKYFHKFSANPGLTAEEVRRLQLPDRIPEDYYELIETINGGEGFIGKEYVVLYKAQDLKKINADYSVEEFTPGIFLFGSNGGGEALAFDLRDKHPKYVLIPFIFEFDAIMVLGESLNEFLERVYLKGYFG